METNGRKAWLHWIGNNYYTIASFIREAKKMGVSRRIKPVILKGMEWDTRIYLVSREPGAKAPVIFGFFDITAITGVEIPPDKLKEMIADGRIDVKEITRTKAEVRGCGRVVLGCCVSIFKGKDC